MRIQHAFFILSAILVTGCSTTGNPNQNRTASKIVENIAQTNVEHLDIVTLNTSFVDERSSSPYTGSVVELSGEVVAFALTEDGLYTVSLKQESSTVICVFNDSIANQLGDDRSIHNGAMITVQGQCYSSGLFSSNSFSLDGCRIVSN
jgi:hypothetical protein